MKCYPTSATRVFLQIPLIQHRRKRKLGSCSVERGYFHFKEDFFSSQYLIIPPIIIQLKRSAFEPRKWCRTRAPGSVQLHLCCHNLSKDLRSGLWIPTNCRTNNCCCHYRWFVSLIQVLHLKERSIQGWSSADFLGTLHFSFVWWVLQALNEDATFHLLPSFLSWKLSKDESCDCNWKHPNKATKLL